MKKTPSQEEAFSSMVDVLKVEQSSGAKIPNIIMLGLASGYLVPFKKISSMSPDIELIHPRSNAAIVNSMLTESTRIQMETLLKEGDISEPIKKIFSGFLEGGIADQLKTKEKILQQIKSLEGEIGSNAKIQGMQTLPDKLKPLQDAAELLKIKLDANRGLLRQMEEKFLKEFNVVSEVAKLGKEIPLTSMTDYKLFSLVSRGMDVNPSSLPLFEKMVAEVYKQLQLPNPPSAKQIEKEVNELLTKFDGDSQLYVQAQLAAKFPTGKPTFKPIISPQQYEANLKAASEKKAKEDADAKLFAAKAKTTIGSSVASTASLGSSSLNEKLAALLGIENQLADMESKIASAGMNLSGLDGKKQGLQSAQDIHKEKERIAAQIAGVKLQIAAQSATGETADIMKSGAKAIDTMADQAVESEAHQKELEARQKRLSEIPEEIFKEWKTNKIKPPEMLKMIADHAENEQEYKNIMNVLCGKIAAIPGGKLVAQAMSGNKLTFGELKKEGPAKFHL